jgi:hypothetical protein
MSSKFPRPMLELLQQMASETPDAAHKGPWQHADGTPMQKIPNPADGYMSKRTAIENRKIELAKKYELL